MNRTVSRDVLLYALSVSLAASAAVSGRPLQPQDLHQLSRPVYCQLSPDGALLAVEVRKGNIPKNRNESALEIRKWGSGQVVRRFPDAGRPRWSPDGSQIMFSKDDQVWTSAPSGNAKPRQLTRLEQGASDPVWSFDGSQIAFVAPVARPTGPDTGRLYDDLFLRRWNTYYDLRRKHLWVVDAKGTGKPRDVTPGDFDAYPTAATFSSGDNFCFSADGTAILFAAPPLRNQAVDTNYDVYRVDLKTLQRANLTQDNPAADMGPTLSRDGKKLYRVAHRRPGYESDLTRLLSCPVDPSGNPQGAWTEERTGVGEFHPDDLYTRYEHAATKGYQGDRLLNPTGSLHSLSADRSGRRVAAVYASMKNPPFVWMHDGAKATELWVEQPKDLSFGAVESVEIPVEGASMQMWIIKPANFDPASRWPVAMLVHGGPQGGWGDDWSLRWNPQAWAAQGFVVAMPNPRGSSGRGMEFQEQVSRDWGGRAYRDLMKGADYLKRLPYVDGSKMVAAGASYGGYMVNWFAVNEHPFQRLVTHCGIWNLESMAGTTDELWFSDWELGGPAWSGSPDYEKFSPHKFAKRLRTPHLVIHNDRDFRCPINQGLELFTALQRLNVPSKFLNFPDEGHWVLKPANSVRWYREVFDFVRS